MSLPYSILKAKIYQKLLCLFILKQCLGMSGIFPNGEVLWIVIKLELRARKCMQAKDLPEKAVCNVLNLEILPFFTSKSKFLSLL
jgi:hypothetical protein